MKKYGAIVIGSGQAGTPLAFIEKEHFGGMISVGLAELQEYQLVARCKVPTPVAVATSVFVVVITVLVASAGHFFEFAKEGGEVLSQVINIAISIAFVIIHPKEL